MFYRARISRRLKFLAPPPPPPVSKLNQQHTGRLRKINNSMTGKGEGVGEEQNHTTIIHSIIFDSSPPLTIDIKHSMKISRLVFKLTFTYFWQKILAKLALPHCTGFNMVPQNFRPPVDKITIWSRILEFLLNKNYSTRFGRPAAAWSQKTAAAA
jgi:hypothetical protein